MAESIAQSALAILHRLPVGVVMADADGNVRFANPVAARAADEHFGGDIGQLLNADTARGDLLLVRLDMPSPPTGRAILVFRPRALPDLDLDWLTEAFALTPAESETIRVYLANHGSVPRTAHARGVSPNTVKTQMKSVHRKLGTSSPLDLLTLVLGSPATLVRPP